MLCGLAASALAAAPEFVPNARCAECHQQAFKAWTASHHDHAMQLATPSSVLGDFDDARFELFGVTTRFFKRGDAFFVNTEGPDGELHDYKVSYTFGVDPLQQYLVEFPGGRLQALTIAWDVHRKRWYSLYPGERVPPDDALHWTGIYQNWNAMCAECHSTNLDEGYSVEDDTFETTWSELNVSCQACHGPGSAHLKWAETRASGDAPAEGANGLVVDFKGQDARYQVEQCARCHARRDRVSAKDAHGRAFMDDFVPVTLRADLYHADGQIDGEVYVYGSFVQSRMYAAGVRCTDCHEPHSNALKADGNALCTRCHQATPDARFSGLKANDYDSGAHHFHAPGSQGAQCVNCHMPGKTYMGIDFRRDHSFRVPRPDVSARIGTPNACTGCHDDQTPQWAAAEIAKRFPNTVRAAHYGEAIAAARSGAPGSGKGLAALTDDVTQAAMVRATALGLLGNDWRDHAGSLARALSDPDPLVRVGALSGLASLPPELRVAGASKVIDDPVRAVRSEAARLLAPVPIDRLPNQVTVARAAALEEQEAAFRARAALPGGRLALAVLAETRGDYAQAERHYRTALKHDKHFQPARFNLANLLNRLGRNAETEQVLRDGLVLTPDAGELHYSLGLVLAEQQRIEAAVESLERAAALMPERGRVRYNLALALSQIGRADDALTTMKDAQRLAPNDPSILQALLLDLSKRERWSEAEPYALTLQRVAPRSRLANQVLQRIDALRRAGLID